jgi:hypothetical protein
LFINKPFEVKLYLDYKINKNVEHQKGSVYNSRRY